MTVGAVAGALICAMNEGTLWGLVLIQAMRIGTELGCCGEGPELGCAGRCWTIRCSATLPPARYLQPYLPVYMLRRARYGVAYQLRYLPMRVLHRVRGSSYAICLRTRYALSGTDVGYGGTSDS
eukprot:3894581-Rhodomonas_salina.2